MDDKALELFDPFCLILSYPTLTTADAQLGVRPVRPRRIPKVSPDMMCSAWKGNEGNGDLWGFQEFQSFGRMLRTSRRGG